MFVVHIKDLVQTRVYLLDFQRLEAPVVARILRSSAQSYLVRIPKSQIQAKACHEELPFLEFGFQSPSIEAYQDEIS